MGALAVIGLLANGGVYFLIAVLVLLAGVVYGMNGMASGIGQHGYSKSNQGAPGARSEHRGHEGDAEAIRAFTRGTR